MGKNGPTKKEINRMKKADLIKFITSHNLPCSKKMSKKDLVQCVFKHKGMRSAFVIPAKRKMSEKQMANLNKFKIGGKNHKDFKKEKVIKPKSTYLADLGEINDKEPLPARQMSHIKEVANDNKVSGKLERVRKRELVDSTHKTPDVLDRQILGEHENRNNQRLVMAEGSAKHRRDVRFGEGQAATGFDISILLDKNGKLDPAKIKAVKAQLQQKDPKNPVLQTILMLELMIDHNKKPKKKQKPVDFLTGDTDLISAVELAGVNMNADIDPDGILTNEEAQELRELARNPPQDVSQADMDALDAWIKAGEKKKAPEEKKDELEEKGQNLQQIVNGLSTEGQEDLLRELIAGGDFDGSLSRGEKQELMRLLRVSLQIAGVQNPSELPVPKNERPQQRRPSGHIPETAQARRRRGRSEKKRINRNL